MPVLPEIILNVDDNEPGRYATTRILNRAGFQVLEAGTGKEALRLARSASPQLVVLDVNLPDMSGIDVCRQLKTDPATAGIMVLQVSATNIAVLDRVSSLSAGADSFLVEPMEPEELEAVARALLRLHRVEAELRRSLAEREMLLREVNHRVKNSLQLVLSMLSLQGGEFREAGAREIFAKAIARVTAIASIHERLYQDTDPLSIDMQTYLTGLCAELARAGIGDERHADLRTDIESLRLPTENGVSLALIVNELVMNALKHGRPSERSAIINVSLRRLDAGHARLTIADNGPGIAVDRAGGAEKPAGGLGSRLINMLVRQLNGELRIEHADGYAAHITFPVQAAAPWDSKS
ncbi:histidine kinase dimerization/phosphoacceptor domain -containing protein [Peristeroidobacter agariperforans]|uniref:histidine kinase dimerization/phosphoacceptor domain -containing protein n=1 Tax=Peristeroidobacter agariperforans TaxID=268404 RepID=UPI00101C7EC5|nr:histidine kinase dimerization/phosphoacceptor domain -containing protein [Peristeroidobacter agariperforans]